MYSIFFKRIFDFVLACAILLLLLPLIFISFLLIKLDSKGPLFFFQDRLGKDAKVFKVYKIRTMTNKIRHTHKEVFTNDEEVTGIGKFFRRFKIDELPQIINIILGDMSFVGPRPCLPSLINEFNEDGQMRIKVRPGLTGLAQINGNIHLSWPKRWAYDRRYVENISFSLDMKIIFRTIFIVIKGEEKFIKN